MSQSAFPVELMNEIFRSSELKPRHLARCCLLSRRYLRVARQWLYREIRVDLIRSKPKHGERIEPAIQYKKSTWRLLQTLNGNAELQGFVRDVTYGAFHKHRSGIWTLPSHAFHNFFALTPNVRRLYFDQEELIDTLWPITILGEATVAQLARIEAIYIGELTVDAAQILLKFKGLKRLSFWVGEDAPNSWEFKVPSGLQSVYISVLSNLNLSYTLRPSTDTLTRLYIPLRAFLTLKYTDYPALKHLSVQLEMTHVTVEEVDDASETWSSFSQSSLQTLAFDGQLLDTELEDRIFGGGQLFLRKAPPTLRRIEFLEAVSLDRLYEMCKYECFEEVAISNGAIGSLKAELVSAMCEASNKRFFSYTCANDLK